MELKGKTVVVTGADGGMGRVLCDRLAKAGANLALCSIDGNAVAEQGEKLKKEYGVQVFTGKADVTKEEEVEAFLEKAAETCGPFYALVNLAGLSVPGKIEETDVDIYDKIMDVNVKGTFLMSKHFAHRAEAPAIIVNLGSTAAKAANPNAPLYCTAKAAVNMLSRGMLLQMGAKDIRVTTINPGGTDTPFWGNRTVDKSKLMSAEDVVDILMFALTSSPRVQIHDIYFESANRF